MECQEYKCTEGKQAVYIVDQYDNILASIYATEIKSDPMIAIKKIELENERSILTLTIPTSLVQWTTKKKNITEYLREIGEIV